MAGDKSRHVRTATGVKHGHHRGIQRRVFVVFLPVKARRPVEQMAEFDLRMGGERRVVRGRRLTQLEAPFAIGHAQSRRQQALAHRPGQMRGTGLGRPGVALVNNLPVTDHQQRIGANALATNIIAGREGIGAERLKRGTARRLGATPVGARPGLGLGQRCGAQTADQQ